MGSRLTETDERIFIDHIPPLEWGKHHDTSFIRATQLTLNAIGEDYSYAFLMGISGAAFRFHFHPDWCPSASDPTTGFDVSKVLFNSLGYNCKLRSINDQSLEDIVALYKAIKEQVIRGIPVVAINLKANPEWGIITGYLKDQPGIICRTYYDEDENYSLAEHAPWLSFFIGEKDRSLDSRVLLANSLRMAVQLAKTDAFEKYYSGFNALENWIDELNRHSKDYKEGIYEQHEVNLTLAITLLDSRRAAVDYMQMMNKSHVLINGEDIIDNYKREVKLLADLFQNDLPSFDDGQKEWTNAILRKQVSILEQILGIERNTIELIEKELLTI